jgi:hypothetical protein
MALDREQREPRRLGVHHRGFVDRRIVNDALRHLATAKRSQDDTLDLDARPPEAPGSALDLNG